MERRRILVVAAALVAALGAVMVFLYVRGADTRAEDQFETTDEAARVVPIIVQPGDVVLVKGSRAMAMEKIVAALGGEAGEAHAPAAAQPTDSHPPAPQTLTPPVPSLASERGGAGEEGVGLYQRAPLEIDDLPPHPESPAANGGSGGDGGGGKA